MTWAQQYGEVIAEIHKTIPADATWLQRRRILEAQGRPTTSHGKKAWAKAKRQYLEGHGQPHGYGMKKAPSPLFEGGAA